MAQTAVTGHEPSVTISRAARTGTPAEPEACTGEGEKRLLQRCLGCPQCARRGEGDAIVECRGGRNPEGVAGAAGEQAHRSKEVLNKPENLRGDSESVKGDSRF